LPEYFGKWLKAVPKEDEYILFFVEREIKDRKGNPKKTIGLYEPHVFAFKALDPELEKILNTIKAAKE
jgi:hypothetical protein